MAGQTARAARIGFGQGFDVGLQLRRQRFNESLALRASGRAERSLQLQEDRLALQQQEFANETFSIPQLNSIDQSIVGHFEAAEGILTGKDSKSRFVSSEETERSIAEFKNTIKFDLLGKNKQDQINSRIDFIRRTGLPPEFDAKGEMKIQGVLFGQQVPDTFGETATQVADDFLSTQPAFREQNIDDITQLSDTDFDELERQDQPAFRSVTAPNPREEQAFRGGSFR